jgi:hypothetical protein
MCEQREIARGTIGYWRFFVSVSTKKKGETLGDEALGLFPFNNMASLLSLAI